MANETDPEDRAAEAVEEALEAFRDLLTPADKAASRELLLDVLAAHPVGRLLAERVRDRRRTLNSCEHPTMGVPPKDPPKESNETGDPTGKGRASGGSR
jgi:hypothetical protein